MDKIVNDEKICINNKKILNYFWYFHSSLLAKDLYEANQGRILNWQVWFMLHWLI